MKCEQLRYEYLPYQDADPATLDARTQLIAQARLRANVYTDNIFSLQGWLRKEHGIPPAQVCAIAGIPEDLDYV